MTCHNSTTFPQFYQLERFTKFRRRVKSRLPVNEFTGIAGKPWDAPGHVAKKKNENKKAIAVYRSRPDEAVTIRSVSQPSTAKPMRTSASRRIAAFRRRLRNFATYGLPSVFRRQLRNLPTFVGITRLDYTNLPSLWQIGSTFSSICQEAAK